MKHQLSQQTSLKQTQNLLPSQIQLLQLIKLNHQELIDAIQEEAYSNPFLEAKIDDSNREITPIHEESKGSDSMDQDENELPSQILSQLDSTQRSISDDEKFYEYKLSNITEAKDFRTSLKDQLKTLFLTQDQVEIAEYIIESLDEDGYLRRRLDDIADDFHFTQGKYISEESVLYVLEQIQSLEPKGIAARNIKECLILQLESLPHSMPHASLALILVDEYFEALAKGDLDALAKSLHVSKEDLDGAIELIREQNPYPVQKISEQEKEDLTITPEFTIERDHQGHFIIQSRGNQIELKLNEEELKHSSYKADTQKGQKTVDKFLNERLLAANEFIQNVQARFKTLTDIMAAIVNRQKAFFETGDMANLVPMTLKDISDDTGYDVSSISRATSTKYAMTEYGVIALKDMFNHAILSRSGEAFTQNDVKERIKSIINNEPKDQPYSDQEITDKLKEEGFDLVRRTIAKYRSELQIPNQQLRK